MCEIPKSRGMTLRLRRNSTQGRENAESTALAAFSRLEGEGFGALDGAGGPKRRRDAPALRLLVVDDHRDTCIGMKMVLERRGYFVTVAHSAEEAVTKIGADDFDLLISDIGLPDRSGYELMEELHSSKGLRGIAVSGFGMENDVSRARAAGFAEHLTKPIDFERLEQAIHRIAEIDSVTAERT